MMDNPIMQYAYLTIMQYNAHYCLLARLRHTMMGIDTVSSTTMVISNHNTLVEDAAGVHGSQSGTMSPGMC